VLPRDLQTHRSRKLCGKMKTTYKNIIHFYTTNIFHSRLTVRNADIRRITNQPPLSSIIKSCCLTFFGHLARMDENADASQAIFEPPPENWRRPPGWPHTTWMKNIHDDLFLLDLGIHEARDLVQNHRPLWRLMSLHRATHS